ncbi:pre-rRNA-processing protein TSR1 homolog [Branchiostoma floridae]|uniref:Pre-rRNA-processing protein TSR1 homolog n=1 Tax=Branchiostoma floridae TaxID=7739 RepID=A0A9J7L910_BRAFL|nr:pre-rRNA-processing protein TSR1 homolog [Branchiostoma floridae]
MAPMEHRHRPGPLKQDNKSHKTGRHRTKGQIDKEYKGRVPVKAGTKRVKREKTKADKRHHAMQKRQKSREEVFMQKRTLGGATGPPHTVVIVPLCDDVSSEEALTELLGCDDTAVVYTTQDNKIVNMSVPRHKHRFTFLTPPRNNIGAILDAAKAADTLLLLLSPTRATDELGEHCLTCLFAQGLPTPVLVTRGINNLPVKKRNDAKRSVNKAMERRFPDEKVHTLDSQQDAALVLRHVTNQKQRRLKLRDHRPYLLAQNVSYQEEEESPTHGTLKLTGYLRGCPLSVNGLVHLPGYGDFQMTQIDLTPDPHPLQKQTDKKKQKDAMDTESPSSTCMEQDVQVLARADPSRQESLQAEVVPDPMEGEQTWPTEEEIREAEAALKEKIKTVKKVPKGTSDYQAAWIVDSEDEGDNAEEESDSDSDDDAMMEAVEEEEDEEEAGSIAATEDYEEMSLAGEDRDAKYDAGFDAEEEEEMLQKYKDERQDQMFPDEVDTPMDALARIRFQKYRGLKSFRTSPWDPKENLPLDFARIFQFESFKRTAKRVLTADRDDTDAAMPGWYITIHVANVPKTFIESYSPSHPLVVYGLLQHEQKMSVVHFLVKRHSGNTEPIKSKERMIFHVGYRRFAACPVYSQHTLGNKHKFERFLRSEGTSVATVYAPIMFPPASVLMFKEYPDGSQSLVATGSLLSVNPDRVVAKRIVLSGHPFKINRRLAVVRYMFFNREDIMWFKPVELRTKWGRRGHIKEPIGTHGHMKCFFDGQLKSQDTVLMNLYKRVYPKWTYDPEVNMPPPEQPLTSEVTSVEEEMG